MRALNVTAQTPTRQTGTNTISGSTFGRACSTAQQFIVTALAVLVFPHTLVAAETVFTQDFGKATEVPEDFMVLAGEFKVVDDGGNKVIELNPVPLETYSFLFGPTAKKEEQFAVRARIKSATKGRLAPTFGVGLGGVTGHVLRLAGAKKQIELVRGDVALTSAASEWKSDTWLWFHLQVRSESGKWIVEGKTWSDGTPEPTTWQISHSEDKPPVTGRPSAWGIPYSGKAVFFDDLSVMRLP